MLIYFYILINKKLIKYIKNTMVYLDQSKLE